MTEPAATDPPAQDSAALDAADAEPFQIEVTIAASVEAVWRELREPARVRHWHGWDAEGNDPEIELIYFTDVTESPGEYRLEVNGGDAFTLHPQGARTLVRMTRAPMGVNPEWDAYYEDINEGWLTFMQQLRFALEHHTDAERRTLFLSGASTGAGDPREELGLSDVAEGPAGGRYDDTVVDERVGGQLWFRSPNQLGVTVDEWGEGLLVVGATPGSPSQPHGGAMAVLTTYGLDDPAFADLAARWEGWWQQRYPSADGVVTWPPADAALQGSAS